MNDIVLAFTPKLDDSGAVAGMSFVAKAIATNTGAMTAIFPLIGGGTVSYPMKDLAGNALRAGDWVSGRAHRMTFDGTNMLVWIYPREMGFSAHKNGTDQTGIVTATYTKLTFSTEVYDQGGTFDAVTNSRWTPPAGRIRIDAGALFSANVVDQNDYRIAVYKNGSRFRTATYRSSGTGNISATITIQDLANGTDYYEIFVYGAGTGNKTVEGDATDTYFMGSVIL